MQSTIVVPLESPAPTRPIIELDINNDPSVLSMVKALGYFYISRSSAFGEIPNDKSLKLLAEELFDLSLENKIALGSDYVRSIDFNEPPLRKELITFKSSSPTNSLSQSIHIRLLFGICQQISIHISDLLDLPSPSSASPDTILFNHYFQTTEPLLINQSETPSLQFHLLSTCALQRLNCTEHQWEPVEHPSDLTDYILVTLPDFIHRYSLDPSSGESSNYTANYLSYNSKEPEDDRSYCLSLKQSVILRYVTFFYLYVMQGIPAGFSTTALANYLTAEGEQSSTVGTFVSLSNLPWALQFVWGPLIDRFQSSPMGRRRPWVIGSQICAFLASLGLLLVRNPPTEYVKTLVIAFFVHSVFASIQDASVDAQAITTIPLSERGRVNGFMRGGFLVGSAVGAAGLSWILRNRSYILAASINSVILFTFTFITFFIKEKSDDKLLPCSRRKGDRRKKHYTKPYDYSICRLFIELFKGLLSLQSLRFFIPILLVYASQSAFIRAYNIHLIKVLGWSDTSVSILSGAWSTVIVVAVALSGGWLADRVGARRLLVVVIFIHACFMITVNLLEPHWYKRPVATVILVVWTMMDPILSTASMPVLMSLCRSHVEGSQFTTYMSMVNLCDLAGAFISGYLQQSVRANIIGLGCAVLIVCAFIVVSIAVYYESRHADTAVVPTTIEEANVPDQQSWKDCWPIRFCVNYHRGSFKMIA